MLASSSAAVFSVVTINEFSSFETSGDWVELYVDSEEDVSGWIIRDTASSIVKTIPDGTIVNAGGFYIVETGNRLNKDGDVIRLLKADDSTKVDEVAYGSEGGTCAPESASHSIGRSTDGNGSFVRFSQLTKQASNNGASQSPCPTPTPEPTPKPTATPKPTSTPKSTTSSQQSIQTNQESEVAESQDEAIGVVAGVQNYDDGNVSTFAADFEIGEIMTATFEAEYTPVATEESESNDKGNNYLPFMISGGGLVLLTSVVPILLKRYNMPLWEKLMDKIRKQ
jgi:hypothetical protein